MNNTIRSIIVISIAILLIILAINLFVWLLPFVIIGILIMFIYTYIKRYINKNKNIKEESTVFKSSSDEEYEEYEDHKIIDVSYEDVDNKKK